MTTKTLADGLEYDADALNSAGVELRARGDALVALADKARALTTGTGTAHDPGPGATAALTSPLAAEEGFTPHAPPMYSAPLTALTGTVAKYDSEVRALGKSLQAKGDALVALGKKLDEQEEEAAAKLRDAQLGGTPSRVTPP